ncbi:MAG: MoxR family ATPase [Acidimicrobiales bacterium]
MPTDSFAETFSAVAANVEQVLHGKPEVIELVLIALVAQGHVLIEDVPGVGKTSLAKALARSLDCTWRRVQFTPDLLPADVVGGTVWDRDAARFDFRPGPIFANLVLADEINRASPKTQSALLEAMEERQVTVDGVGHPLPSTFIVLATQNPIEHTGTYPLPESQLDRFMLRVGIGYPDRGAELAILDAPESAHTLSLLRPVAAARDIQAMAAVARETHVAPSLKGYIIDIAEATRHHPALDLGMSPRASLALMHAARARAVASGRNYMVPDDVKALAEPVLAHRLIRSGQAAMQALDTREIVADVLRRVPVPSGRG